MGISFIVFGGGEPFVRKEMLDITRDHPKMLFMVFTNGLLIDEAVAATLKKQRNLVPVISLEGHEADTDGRRGAGVHARLQTVIERVRNKGVFWGVSLTMTRGNFATLTDERFVGDLVKQGCKLFFFVEYSPVRKGTEGWVVTDEQRQSAARLMQRFRASYPALFISVPGDEDAFGGCLSAGRGFIHISAEGNLEPCPFAPYSDVNLRDMPLKEALRSEFLKRIRDNHRELSEAEGGCALWVKREWVRSLLREKQPAAAR
jgi:MoaA/NifB/PqqE/SkfB family radical SAM enzyme